MAEKAFRDMGIPVTPGVYNPAATNPPPYGTASYSPGALPPIASIDTSRPEPIGAIVLIAVGMLFLLSTLGVFHMDWIGRGWPVLIILLGAGLLFSRVRSTRRAGGGL